MLFHFIFEISINIFYTTNSRQYKIVFIDKIIWIRKCDTRVAY